MENCERVKAIATSDQFIEMDTYDQVLFFHLVSRMNNRREKTNPEVITMRVGFHEKNIENIIDKGFLSKGIGGLILPLRDNL